MMEFFILHVIHVIKREIYVQYIEYFYKTIAITFGIFETREKNQIQMENLVQKIESIFLELEELFNKGQSCDNFLLIYISVKGSGGRETRLHTLKETY